MYRITWLFMIPFLLLCSFLVAEDLPGQVLTEDDRTALNVCEGVIQLFRQHPESIWPGYNLADRPFIFYMPEKWTLLFNRTGEADGFTSYPKDWPYLGTDVLYHKGQYKHLAGQIAFELPVADSKVAAIPFMKKSEVTLFAFIVHEAFHQYQYAAFGEIPWEREEKYPIEDPENTALAHLEMRLLMDALKVAESNRTDACKEYMKQFVAVRNCRWKRCDPYVMRYEQGKELSEGTAKYVELKSVALMAQLDYASSLDDRVPSLLKAFASISMPEFLLEVFRAQCTGDSISPEDMPRNRIYPVGSAQGFLLDYLEIDWMDRAQKAGSDFTFEKLFRTYLNVEESRFDDLLDKAKSVYGYEEILAISKELIREYQDQSMAALKSFEAQSGDRIEIDLSSMGIGRSRSSTSKKWLIDRGTRELRKHFNIYVLKSKDLLLQVRDTGVLEQNDWEAYRKRVVFFVPKIESISLNGESIASSASTQKLFKSIKMWGENFKLDYAKAGTLLIKDHHLKIDLE